MKPEGWDTPFEDPVPRPRGRPLATLREARDYIARLPASSRRSREWQDASAYLEKAANVDLAWRWFARSAVYRAIHGDAPARPERRMTERERFREVRRRWKESQKR